MSQIGVSYTPSGGSPVYSLLFTDFSDNSLPRSYLGNTSFTQSANGASIIAGPAFRQKYVWVISSIVTKEEAALFDQMFQAWDTDRSNGIAAAVGITDQTFGSTVTTSAVITTPPTYNRMGPKYMLLSFGLTEV